MARSLGHACGTMIPASLSCAAVARQRRLVHADPFGARAVRCYPVGRFRTCRLNACIVLRRSNGRFHDVGSIGERPVWKCSNGRSGSFADLEQGSMPCMEYFARHRIGRVKAQEI